jgi:rhodanese-related sulfurtransferase
MGWHLAGFELARGQTHCAPLPTSTGLAAARAAAARVAKRFGVRYIDVATVAQFAREMDRRTLYLFDVRSPENFRRDICTARSTRRADNSSRGTDTFAATRNARIVLIDDHGVRATMTASWLIQMGWPEVYVVENALESGPLYKGEPPAEVLGLAQILAGFHHAA